jgi:hypothetical protein
VEKRISYYIGHEVLFYETAFSASAFSLLSANHATTEAADWVDADREADYRRLSPLRRKTSSAGSFPGIYVIGDKIKSVFPKFASRAHN